MELWGALFMNSSSPSLPLEGFYSLPPRPSQTLGGDLRLFSLPYLLISSLSTHLISSFEIYPTAITLVLAIIT